MADCPCGSGRALAACCGRFHDGQPAPDAHALMRSRYSAYALKRRDYLLATWHPSTRPEALDLDDPPGARTVWLGLDIKRHAVIAADRADVEFVARWRSGGGKAQRLHETSRFVRENGRWYYLNGDIR